MGASTELATSVAHGRKANRGIDRGKTSSQSAAAPPPRARSWYERTIKRLVDLSVAAIGLVLLVLAFPAVALAVRLSGPGPVLLRQRRVGAEGLPFSMVKFRTMVVDAEADGRAVWSCDNDARITAVGRVLRAYHLDELPQLWNVLVGEMSLVGPRPERLEISRELDVEIPQWHRRHDIRPGITGWAQVRQGYVDSVAGSRTKLAHDLYYLQNCSLRLDLRILAETVGWRIQPHSGC